MNCSTMISEFIKGWEVLSYDEEKVLIQNIRNGSKDSLEIMIKNHMPLVLNIAKKFVFQGVDYDDLISVGVIGLINAINKYELGRGTKLSTLAYNWITQAISREIANNGSVIRKPVNKIEKMVKLNKIKNQLLLDDGFVDYEKLSNTMKMDLKKIYELESYCLEPFSFNNSIHTNDKGEIITLEDAVGKEYPIIKYISDKIEDLGYNSSNYYGDYLSKLVDASFKVLTFEEEKMLRLIYGIGCEKKSIKQIEEELGINRTKIKSIKQKALTKIKRSEVADELKEIYDEL